MSLSISVCLPLSLSYSYSRALALSLSPSLSLSPPFSLSLSLSLLRVLSRFLPHSLSVFHYSYSYSFLRMETGGNCGRTRAANVPSGIRDIRPPGHPATPGDTAIRPPGHPAIRPPVHLATPGAPWGPRTLLGPLGRPRSRFCVKPCWRRSPPHCAALPDPRHGLRFARVLSTPCPGVSPKGLRFAGVLGASRPGLCRTGGQCQLRVSSMQVACCSCYSSPPARGRFTCCGVGVPRMLWARWLPAIVAINRAKPKWLESECVELKKTGPAPRPYPPNLTLSSESYTQPLPLPP